MNENKPLVDMTDAELRAWISHCETMATIMDKKQHALKILVNSLFGAFGSPYFRHYDRWKAEGITLTGQTVLDTAYKSVNEYLNKILKTDSVDYAVAGDTDSGYFDFTAVVDRFLEDGQDPVEFLDRFCNKAITPTLDKAFANFMDRTNGFTQRLNMKREAIGNAVFVAKKNYVMRVYDNEGVRYNTPETKVTGLESKKSSTPKFFREKLELGYMFVFDRPESEFHEFVSSVHDEIMSMPIDYFSAATSISDIEKYTDPNFTGTIPQHAKATIAYNKFIKDKGLEDRYRPIQPGDKIRLIKLKTPNPFHIPAIAYLDKIPVEMGLEKWVDKYGFYEKFFINPIMRVVSQVNWNHEYRSTTDELF